MACRGPKEEAALRIIYPSNRIVFQSRTLTPKAFLPVRFFTGRRRPHALIVIAIGLVYASPDRSPEGAAMATLLRTTKRFFRREKKLYSAVDFCAFGI